MLGRRVVVSGKALSGMMQLELDSAMAADSQFYASATFWTAVGSIGVIAGIVVSFFVRRPPKRLLLYTTPVAASVLTSHATGGPMRSELQVIYRRDTLDDPYLVSFDMQLRSRRDIRTADFDQGEPLEFDFGAQIVTLLPTSGPFSLARKAIKTDGTKVLIGPTLIHKRLNMRIDILTDGKPDVGCDSPLPDVIPREVQTLPDPRLPLWASALRSFLITSGPGNFVSSVLIFLLLLITLAVLGHSVWHSAVVAVANFLTEVFTGGHAIG